MCGCSLIGFEDFSEGVLNYGKKKEKPALTKKEEKMYKKQKVLSHMQRDVESNEDKNYCKKWNHCH